MSEQQAHAKNLDELSDVLVGTVTENDIASLKAGAAALRTPSVRAEPEAVKAVIEFWQSRCVGQHHGPYQDVWEDDGTCPICDGERLHEQVKSLSDEVAALKFELAQTASVLDQNITGFNRAMALKDDAEEQLASALHRLNVAREDRELAEQQLEEQVTLHNGYLVRANTVGRAQVIAEVKALLLQWAGEIENCAEGAHAGINSPIQEMRAYADTFQSDPSLAVISTADREQALQQAYAAGIRTGVMDDTGVRVIEIWPEMSEARRLLQLPESPQ